MHEHSNITRKRFLGLLSVAATTPALAAQKSIPLANESLRLRVSVSDQATWIDQFAFLTDRGFTHSLLHTAPGAPILHSGTALMIEGQAHTSRGGSVESDGVRLGRVRDVLIGPEGRPYARENWLIELDGACLRWRIERHFLEDCTILADRCPALVFATGMPPEVSATGGVYFSEIPGFLDLDMELDGDRGFLFDKERRLYEVLSRKRAMEVAFAPSGMALEFRMDSGMFSYVKRNVDGTAPCVAVGVEMVDRARGPLRRSRGESQVQELTLALRPTTPAAPLALSLPDAGLAAQVSHFATTYNQWFGWMFGNNPASVPIPHEVAWYPMMQGMYASGGATEAALDRQLRFLAERGTDESGYLKPRWGVDGFYKVVWGNLLDQIPHFLLAAYHQVLRSGNRDWLAQMMPSLDRVAKYMLALDRDRDGIFEVPETTGLPDGTRACSNWYDIIRFGHKDAYVNVYCVMALDAMAQMKAYLKDRQGAERFRNLHRLHARAFNRVFWDDARGFYMDWIDIRERMPESGRRWFYTDQNLLAILSGTASAAQARRILANLDLRYEQLCREFRISRDAIYATPCNMNPITQLGDLVDYGEFLGQKNFPNYENGCSFFHTTGFEIAARAFMGDPDGAYSAFERVMLRGYAKNRLWGAALNWASGTLISEPLDNGLMILWGFLRGCFQAWPDLNGVRIYGKPPAKLEGASYRFRHLGRDVSLEVHNGRTVLRS